MSTQTVTTCRAIAISFFLGSLMPLSSIVPSFGAADKDSARVIVGEHGSTAKRLASLEKMVLVNECRHAATQPQGKLLMDGAGGDISLSGKEVFAGSRRKGGTAVEVYLFPAGPEWDVINAYLHAPQGRRYLNWGSIEPFIRHGQVDDSTLECRFESVPEGQYTAIFAYSAKSGSGIKRGIHTRGLVVIEVTGGSSEARVVKSLKTMGENTYPEVLFKDLQ